MELQNTQAIKLHEKIMAQANIVSSAIVTLSLDLKEMRDKKLYRELGFENFGEYTEQMVGIQQRQAYNFIAVVEGFGAEKMEQHSELGITKLSTLLALERPQREEILQNNDVHEMSTREVKELVKELTKKEEQISLFNQNMTEEQAKNQLLQEEKNKLLREKDELLSKIQAFNDKADVIDDNLVEERVKEELKAIESQKNYEKNQEISVISQSYEEEICQLKVERDNAKGQLKEEKRKLNGADEPLRRANVIFEMLQGSMNHLSAALRQIESQSARIKVTEVIKAEIVIRAKQL